MAEKEDLLIQEVNEELNAERLRQWWERFGSWVVTLCLVLIVATSGYVFWKNQRHAANEEVTSILLDTDEAIDRKQYSVAAEQLLTLPDHAGAVSLLARLKAAAVLESAGETDKANAQYKIVATAADQPALAGYARLRLGDTAAHDKDPYRSLATELQAVTLYKDGKKAEARKLLQDLLADPQTFPSARARVEEILAAFQ